MLQERQIAISMVLKSQTLNKLCFMAEGPALPAFHHLWLTGDKKNFVEQEILISLCIALIHPSENIPLRLNYIINKYPTYTFIDQLVIFSREKNTNTGMFFLYCRRQMKVTDEHAN